MKKKTVENIYEFMSSLMTAVIVIVILFTCLFRLVGVKGSSMVPTLENGNWLIVSASKDDYEYKDIVIVVQPNYVYEELNEPLVKRVIATEGQWVKVDYDEGYVYVGDTKDTLKRLDEKYTASLTNVHSSDDTNEYPIQVPDGHLFVMGDNRNHSTDSRSYYVGFIDKRYVLGKALFRVVPISSPNIYSTSK